MKTFITTAIFSLSALLGWGQNAIQNHFSDLAALENITTVSVSGAMFNLVQNFETENEEEKALMEAAEKIQGLTVLIHEKASDADNISRRVESDLEGEFEELLRVSEKETNAVFYVKESDGIITEMFGFVSEPDEWILINLWGEIDLKQVNNMFSKMDMTSSIAGFDSDVASDASQISFYPNPIGKNADGHLEVPEGIVGSTAFVFDMQGNVVREIKITQKQQKIGLSGLPGGTYMVKVIHEKAQVFNQKVIVQ